MERELLQNHIFTVQEAVDLGKVIERYGEAIITTGQAILRDLGIKGEDLQN